MMNRSSFSERGSGKLTNPLAFRRAISGMLGVAAVVICLLAPPPAAAQQADDCKEFARRCCRSLTVAIDDASAYHIAYDLSIRKRGDTLGDQSGHSSVKCIATRDFIWSRGDSIDILRGRDETLTVDKKRQIIIRSDGRLSTKEIDERFRMTTFLQDTLFALSTLRSCVDSMADVPLRIITLSLPPLGGKGGQVSSLIIRINRTDSTVHSIVLKYLGARDGVLRREVRFKEPPHLLPYHRDRDYPVIITATDGEPAAEYRGYHVVDLRNHSRN